MSLRHAVLAAVLLGGLVIGVLVGPSFAASYTPLAKVRPDIVLSPGQSRTITNTTPLIGNGQLVPTPTQCRGGDGVDPIGLVSSLGCKVYRLKVNLDTSPEAMNVVYIRAEFDQVALPPINVAPLGLAPELQPLNGVDVLVYYTADKTQPSGANSFGSPEIGSFLPGQSEFDIVVQAHAGVNKGFRLTLSLSNEIFPKPVEVLDPTAFLPSILPPLTSGLGLPAAVTDPPADLALPQLAVDTDPAIADVGLGVNEQFGPSALDAIAHAARTVPAAERAPSPVALVGGLIVFPTLSIGALFYALRRRRDLLI